MYACIIHSTNKNVNFHNLTSNDFAKFYEYPDKDTILGFLVKDLSTSDGPFSKCSTNKHREYNNMTISGWDFFSFNLNF